MRQKSWKEDLGRDVPIVSTVTPSHEWKYTENLKLNLES